MFWVTKGLGDFYTGLLDCLISKISRSKVTLKYIKNNDLS